MCKHFGNTVFLYHEQMQMNPSFYNGGGQLSGFSKLRYAEAREVGILGVKNVRVSHGKAFV